HPRLALILTVCVVVAAAAVVSIVQVSGTSTRTASRPQAVPPVWARGAVGAGAAGVDVVVASASAAGEQSAPVLLASFGAGASVVEVRAAPPGGSAAYQRAVSADLAAR